jgi:ppGpp synthetase/RelA/SpoT-type nucleotidyltranferase
MMSSRAKDPVELFKKQMRKQYDDFWVDCPDVIGCRIVVSVADEKVAAQSALEASGELTVIEIDDQAANADPNRLDYRGLHIHIRSDDLPGVDGAGIRCEVQIRTMAEHAWAETEHRYLYKKNESIPADVQRVFRRLLVLVELFDEELQKGVDLVRVSPAFARQNLIRHLEQQFAVLSGDIGDERFTRETLELLAEHGFDDVDELLKIVDQYVASNGDSFKALVEEHGPNNETFDPTDDWLISQPESLLLLALLDKDEYKLATALQGNDFATYVLPLARWTDHAGFTA